MARRRSTFDVFMQVASYLPWPTCLALAAGSAVVLHLLAVHLSIPIGSAETVSAVQSSGGLGALYARSLYGTLATFLQFIIPAGLLFAALASFLRRSQAHALLAQAQSAPEAAISSMTWAQFERLIGESFRRRGYEVTETGGTMAAIAASIFSLPKTANYSWSNASTGEPAVSVPQQFESSTASSPHATPLAVSLSPLANSPPKRRNLPEAAGSS